MLIIFELLERVPHFHLFVAIEWLAETTLEIKRFKEFVLEPTIS